jgi:hypothetical protein
MQNKIAALLKSPRFWSLLASLVALGAAYFQVQIDIWQALQGVIAAFAAFSISTGVRPLDGYHTEG